MQLRVRALLILLFCGLLSGKIVEVSAQSLSSNDLRALVDQQNVQALKAAGPQVLPELVRLYELGDDVYRAKAAFVFYNLGWKSTAAKQALMRDARTPNATLRLQVQWALGRVSNDIDVVEVLLNNMRGDGNPLFRDKAACALAYDQIHLTERQKVRLFEGLIDALNDAKSDVRRIALQALQIHTGQTKGFNPDASEFERRIQIAGWRKWLDEYRAAL